MITSKPSFRLPVFRAISGLVLLCLVATSGCVGRREALRVNSALIASSDTAKTVTEKLHESAKAEVDAHQQTRDAFRKIWDDYRQARGDRERQEMQNAYQKTATELAEWVVVGLADLQTKRMEANRNLDEQLKIAFQPLAEKIVGYRTAAEKANEREREYPNDVNRHDARVKADSDYLAASALKLDMELDARKAAIAALDEVQLAAVARIQEIARDHRLKLVQVLNKGLDGVVVHLDAKLDLGPDPAVNDAAFAGLISYAEAVRKAGEGNRDYLVSNSFGPGSFFSDFFSSLGRGVLGGVFNPSSVKGINSETVKASFKDFAGTSSSALKEQLSDVKDSFKTAASDFVSNASSGMSGKLSELLGKLSSEAVKKINAPKPQTSTP